MRSSKYAPKPVDAAPSIAQAAQTSDVQSPNVRASEPGGAPEPVANPNPPIPHMDPIIDEFAQTRPPDDLFDDDFTPIADSASQAVYDPPPPAPVTDLRPQFSEAKYQDVPQSTREKFRGVPRGPRGARGGRRGAGPGSRGRGGGATSGGGEETGRPEGPQQKNPVVPATNTIAQVAECASPLDAEKPDVEQESSLPEGVPTAPKKDTTAVRGDRSLTGGPAKQKLSEFELNAKLAAMSLKNKALTEAYEKAQADQEAFSAREQIAAKVAAERRKVERVERQQLMGERERNRQRKLQALGGREWDAVKNEEDFKDDGRRARRGAHGGVTGARSTAPEMETRDDNDFASRGSQRGRAGRGGRGGRGGGREDHTSRPMAHQKSQSIPTAVDFPDLPVTLPPTKTGTPQAPKTLGFPHNKKAQGETMKPEKVGGEAGDKVAEKPKMDAQTILGLTPATEKRSWADQVEGSSP